MPGAPSIALTVTALVLLILSLAVGSELVLDDFGLASGLDTLYFVGLALLPAASYLEWRRGERAAVWLIVLQLVLFIAIVWITPTILEDAPRFRTSYVNYGYVDPLVRGDGLDPGPADLSQLAALPRADGRRRGDRDRSALPADVVPDRHDARLPHPARRDRVADVVRAGSRRTSHGARSGAGAPLARGAGRGTGRATSPHAPVLDSRPLGLSDLRLDRPGLLQPAGVRVPALPDLDRRHRRRRAAEGWPLHADDPAPDDRDLHRDRDDARPDGAARPGHPVRPRPDSGDPTLDDLHHLCPHLSRLAGLLRCAVLRVLPDTAPPDDPRPAATSSRRTSPTGSAAATATPPSPSSGSSSRSWRSSSG